MQVVLAESTLLQHTMRICPTAVRISRIFMISNTLSIDARAAHCLSPPIACCTSTPPCWTASTRLSPRPTTAAPLAPRAEVQVQVSTEVETADPHQTCDVGRQRQHHDDDERHVQHLVNPHGGDVLPHQVTPFQRPPTSTSTSTSISTPTTAPRAA